MPGFSLLELLIVMVMMGILLALAIPSERSFFQSSTAKMAGRQLYHAIETARNEALIRGKNSMLCHSRDEKSCSGEWRDGFLVMVDNKVLFSFHNPPSDGFIHWRAFPGHQADLVFLPTGFSKVENGTFWYCANGQSDPVWAIVLNQAGRVRLVYPDQNGALAGVSCSQVLPSKVPSPSGRRLG